MAEIVVSHSVCSAIRPKVLTALQPYGVRILDLLCWGEGIYNSDNTDELCSDDYKMAARHIARITVSDRQARYAERLLWQCGTVNLESRPIDPSLNWQKVGACSERGHLQRGDSFTPWSASRSRSRARRQQAQRHTHDDQLLGGLDNLVLGKRRGR